MSIIIVLLIGLVVVADMVRQRAKKVTPPSQQNTVIQQAAVTFLKSEYFQFQAPANWIQIANESTPQKFVYREITNTLINNQLDVYVNSPPKDLLVEYVQPVTVNDDHLSLTSGDISKHCKNSTAVNPANRNPLTMTYEGVTFGCRVDGTEFIVIAGQKGGGTEIKLIRPNGKVASYTLVYHDLTVNPSGSHFSGILDSFQAR